jgi:hypothetical protein
VYILVSKDAMDSLPQSTTAIFHPSNKAFRYIPT